MVKLNGKHRATLDDIFADPIRSNVAWADIEAILGACGSEIDDGRGSRVRIALNGVRAVFHRPHMRHGGYEAAVEYDDDAGLFHGEIVNLRDVITFQGRSVDELRQAFADSVEDYLAFCEKRGEAPEQPYSGELSVRVDPALHRAVISAARRSGITPDEWVSRALVRATA